jgi:hypothetical protein
MIRSLVHSGRVGRAMDQIPGYRDSALTSSTSSGACPGRGTPDSMGTFDCFIARSQRSHMNPQVRCQFELKDQTMTPISLFNWTVRSLTVFNLTGLFLIHLTVSNITTGYSFS